MFSSYDIIGSVDMAVFVSVHKLVWIYASGNMHLNDLINKNIDIMRGVTWASCDIKEMW